MCSILYSVAGFLFLIGVATFFWLLIEHLRKKSIDKKLQSTNKALARQAKRHKRLQ